MENQENTDRKCQRSGVRRKKIEEAEVVFLMDRFGYAKTVDQSVYGKK